MRKFVLFAILNLAVTLCGVQRGAAQQPIYIEAERAQFQGDWFVENREESYGEGNLRGNNTGGTNDAMIIVTVPTTATYNVWARTRDFDTFTGQRQFQLGIDGILFPKILGAHATNGFYWELAGSRTLAAQNHIIQLHDISNYYPRCDAIFLTPNSTDPNQMTEAQLSVSAYKAVLPVIPFRNLDSPDDLALRFSDAGSMTNGLRVLANGGLLAQTTNEAGLLRFAAPTNSSFASAVITSLAGTNILFANATISVDVRFGAPQQSFGIFTRIPSSENNGHLVLVNCDTTGANTTDNYRIYGPGSNPQSTNVSSTLLLNDSNSLLSTGIWYTVRLKVENTGTGGVNLIIQVYDRSSGGLRVQKTATGTSTLTAPGEVALRFFSTIGGQSIDIDNILISENVPGLLAGGARTTVGTLQGAGTHISFYSQQDIDGATQVSRETSVPTSGSWLVVPAQGETLFLQYRESVATFTAAQYVTSWAQPIEFDLNGVYYRTLCSTEDPMLAANKEVFIARSCQQVDQQTVAVTYRSLRGRTVVGTWQMGAGGSHAKLSVSAAADRTGFYSFGLSAVAISARSETAAHLLPPFYLFQRLPASPKLLTSSVTPQPLALVQRTFAGIGQPLTFGVAADPARIPFEWPSTRNGRYGFSLLNSDGTVQPTAFSPILGLTNSFCTNGATVSASWNVVTKLGDWKSGLEYASSQVLGVTDYRQPYRSSLSHALLNMIDLIQDDTASGWCDYFQGPFQIESENTVTHPSPMTYVSASILSHNETLYKERSLPAIEYTLSRPRAHFATDVTSNTPSGYVSTNGTKITVPSTFFGTAHWQGVHDLLGRKNPWLADLALTNGAVRWDFGNPYIPRWYDKLGQYRLNPSAALLQDLQVDCTNWLNTEFLTTKTNPAAIVSFYHYGYYPFWWGLIDLYELTTNSAYLAYAEEGAFHTMAGIFSFPMPPSGNAIANEGGNYTASSTLWWKGTERYRLGWPRTPGDTPERSVPAWLVSPVGYTLEQPSTYYQLDKPDAPFNIQMMAAWAPQLLRLYRHTGRPIYEIYARNAMIGRFSNDPGYYLRGFTDMFHDPLYPYNGPDVSSFYYHHMQARLAFVLDYLFAQAETMSSGKVAFPWAKQHGYVWFTDRIFGMPGTLYNESGLWPWFDRSAANINSEQVDYLLARGRDSFWVILMNQTNTAVTVNLTNNAAALGIITSEPVKVFEGDAPRPDRSYAAPLPVTIPGRKLVSLRFATQTRDVFPREVPLTATPVTQTLPGPWGTMYAFRIRSPFGSDSLYVVLSGRPSGTASAKLLLDGAPLVTKSAYPYEFSVYPWPMNQDMRFLLELTSGSTVYSTPVTLPGTTALPPSAYEEWKTSNGLPANAPNDGDSDGDGWRNLLEYAFRLNPQVPDAPPAPVYSKDGTKLSLSYVKWRSDVAYYVETSLDLQNWTRQGVTETENGGVVTASVPVAAQAQFLRLAVSYP